MTVTLIDPHSGQTVEVRTAQLGQWCGICNQEMQGHEIVTVPDGRGWTCLEHLERRLARLTTTPQKQAQLSAAKQLENFAAGDALIVTQTILIALGTGK